MSATEPGTGGHEAGQAREGDIPNLQRQLEAERAGATYWRERAQHHESALAEIKSRTGVRAVLALERRTAGIRRRAKAVAAEVQAAGSRSALTISALPTRAVIPSRRRALDEAVAQANRMPPLDLRPVLVVCIGVASPPAWAASVASRSTASGSITVTVSEIEDLPEVVSQADDEIELICLVDAQVEPLTSTWLDHLYGSLTENDAAAATGVMVHPQRALAHSTPHDYLIRSAGFEVLTDTSGAPSVVPLLAGSIVSRAVDRTVDLAGGAMLLVDRQAAVAAGGFDRWGSADACAVDLCSRLNRRARAVTVASAALGIDHRDVTDRRGLRRPFDETAPVWCDLLERCGPALRRSAATDRNAPTSFTFAVAAPSPKVADRWGDWHLAEAMSRALRSAGYGAAVHTNQSGTIPGPCVPTFRWSSVAWLARPPPRDATRCCGLSATLRTCRSPSATEPTWYWSLRSSTPITWRPSPRLLSACSSRPPTRRASARYPPTRIVTTTWWWSRSPGMSFGPWCPTPWRPAFGPPSTAAVGTT
ncbi:MAG: hypothetical protein IPG97_04410 [Microthrixaceae bacterium]|nr:hypothetical protein [Microthrixaceae bacterium]